jgi:hypothetical protein
MEFAENKARNGNWSDRILGSPRIPGVSTSGITGYQAAAPNARSLGVETRWKLPHVGEQYSFDG